jgi:polysaccharide export outer membrane protein
MKINFRSLTLVLLFFGTFATRQASAQVNRYAPASPAAPCATCGPAPCATGLCGNGCERQINGVDCINGTGCGEQRWHQWGPIPWQAFQQGEYVGPARLAHVPEYRLRVDDQVEFIYRITRADSAQPYRLQTGDVLRIESVIDTALNREVTIQTDGMIILPLVGQVKASRMTILDVQKALEERYKKYYKIPDITVTPVKTNTRLDDLKATVDNRFFSGGMGRNVRVNPEGTVSLPGINQVPAQGLSLDEIKREVNARYAELVEGLEITPNLATRAPRAVFVVGEVRNSGRYSLDGPTTAMQSIAMAGGWNQGANLREIIVFRRADDWRLMATKLDLRGALYGYRPIPADEIWLRDSDIVVVTKSTLQRADEVIDMVFTRGIYGVFPMNFNYTFGNGGGSVITNP